MSSLEAKRIADAYLQRNTPYKEVKFVDIRNTDCAYKFLYQAADSFGRVVDIYIEIDFIFNNITVQIVVAKSSLMRFVVTLPQATEDK